MRIRKLGTTATTTALGLALVTVGGAAIVLAGPPEVRPLRLAGPQPAAPADAQPLDPTANQGFYYAAGKKVFLSDTGLAVAKLKKPAEPDEKNLPFAATNLASFGPLAEMTARLRRAGLVIVSTHGPAALDIHKAAAAFADHIDWMMPIVEPVSGPGALMPGAMNNALIMTPRISARFGNDVTPKEVEAYLLKLGLKVAQKQEYVPNGYVLELAQAQPNYTRVLQAANKLYEQGKADRKVVYAHPDFIPVKKKLDALALPPDPFFSQQWHLRNTGQAQGTIGADVKALQAWRTTKGKRDVVVAVIDDSVDRGHPDLNGNYVAGRYYEGVTGTDSNDPSPKDGGQRHGTCCAGVAVAASNDIGGSGVAPACALIGVNFWDATTAQTAEAFYFCRNNGACVISCSWSWGAAFDDVSLAVKEVHETGRNGKGVPILFAAGNEYGSIAQNQIFGTLKEVICVGATNWRDDRAKYSNVGPELSVVAPSSDFYDTPPSLSILTTDNTDGMPRPFGVSYSGYEVGDYTPSQGPRGFGGTSSATPLAAGVCALILSANPNLTAKQVREILETSADKVPGVTEPANYDAHGHSRLYGYGRVNAENAVAKAKATTTSP